MTSKRFDTATKIFAGILFGVILFIIPSCNPSTENSAESVEIIPTPEIIVTQLAGKLVIIADVANLRTGPGVTFELHGTLNKGETVEFDGVLTTGSWYRLIDGSWVAENFVELVNNEMLETATSASVTDSPTSPPTETPSSTVTLTATPTKIPPSSTLNPTITFTDSSITCQTTSDVFLFSGPGNANAYHIVKTLNKGIDMVVLGGNRQNGNHTHYKVRDDNGNQGWLFIDLCPVADAPSIGFQPYPPTFTPTASSTPIPSYTPTPSFTPTPTPTLIQAILPTATPTLILAVSSLTPGATTSPTLIPPATPTSTPTVIPGTSLPPESTTPTATGTQPSPNAFR